MDTTAEKRGNWIVTGAWALLIFLLSSIPGKDLEFIPPIWGWDKLAHMTVYGILGVLVFRSLGYRKRAFGLVIILCVAYGLLDEFHQVFVPGRTPSLADLAADTIGSTAGLLLFRWRQGRLRNAQRKPLDEQHADNV